MQSGLLYTSLYVAAGAGLLQIGWFVWLVSARLYFPLDLEWMEGGLLVHADRLAHGLPIYAPPSVDFIPFLYTPLYPYLLAMVSQIAPLGYVLGRAVSLASFVAVLVLMARGARAEQEGVVDGSGPRPWVLLSVAGAGAMAASFGFSGSFYDLVRADSLLMFFQASALMLAFRGNNKRSAALAGVAIALGFFTKQTASVFGLALGLGLLATNFRRALSYGSAAVLTLAVGLALLQWKSAGWFWTYVFELHQSHPFDARAAFWQTPVALLKQLWPTYLALVIAVAVLWRQRQLARGDLLLGAATMGGVIAACVASGTQWAFANAYIPAVIFPTIAVVIAAVRLVLYAQRAPARNVARWSVSAVALALALQAVASHAGNARSLAPSDADRAASRAFLQRLGALTGRPFIPFHPYYATLLGSQPSVHRMGVWDVADKLGVPRGLATSIAGQEFGFIVLDADSRAGEWPGLETSYRLAHVFTEGVDAARSFSGAATTPHALWLPKNVMARAPSSAAKREAEH